MKTKKESEDKKTTPEKEVVLTKEAFLNVLKKVTRPLPPKASHEKEKSKTSE